MNWERFLMDAATGAVIGAGATLVISIFINIVADLRGYHKIDGKIGDIRGKSITRQHDDMEAHLSREHHEITDHIDRAGSNQLKKLEANADTVTAIKEMLTLQQKDEENRHQMLTKEQQEIKVHVDYVYELLKDWERLNELTVRQEAKIGLLRASRDDYRQMYEALQNERNKDNGQNRGLHL